ncbi:sulfate reduction electron transfer complex DsrMKJOP subunit DsrP [Geothrix edaphica]|uniref:Hdr menaquinol oxidoreductase integral membrane subunit n=1 Tax=Geothrix edaphica TaxID=2927976 RepID=A0ABQ5PVE5_9BACT|nr:NrfD/PsrC family molybdoenzyme membrane anchor subunit [Geothrix edaphica]GLH66338.1 Hdr menaquinol oxidoreductase integral membrane subunit [Geothrix edaphica]
MFTLRNFSGFLSGTLRLITKGGRLYYAWVGFLLLLIAIGAGAYIGQLKDGLIVTKMRDQVSWGFYIGNFTFLVGVAAAAIMLVIPAYIYDWEPIKEITILGEMLAISALIMCLGFVMVDIGRPDRFWHIIPLVGRLNWPQSMLAWDVIVLNLYLLLNWFVVTYLLFCAYTERHYVKKLVLPLVLLSIPMAVSIHTVTAYLYNGLAARPFWNSAILAPRFLASAFCSGPAILLILLQVLRKTTKLTIKDEAIFKVAELMAYTMGFNLFLTAAEAFKELYSGTEHMVYFQYLLFGLKGHTTLVPYAWASILCGLVAFILFLVPRTRTNWVTLNIGCVLIYASVYIEKGMGLIIPGLTPDVLGDIYVYRPSFTEIAVAAGIFAIGFLAFTLMLKAAVPMMLGEFTITKGRTPVEAPPQEI